MKIKSTRDIFDYIKFSKLITDFTGINIKSGIQHRINGKNTNGNPRELTDSDKKEIKEGLETMIGEVNEVIKKEL